MPKTDSLIIKMLNNDTENGVSLHVVDRVKEYASPLTVTSDLA